MFKKNKSLLLSILLVVMIWMTYVWGHFWIKNHAMLIVCIFFIIISILALNIGSDVDRTRKYAKQLKETEPYKPVESIADMLNPYSKDLYVPKLTDILEQMQGVVKELFQVKHPYASISKGYAVLHVNDNIYIEVYKSSDVLIRIYDTKEQKNGGCLKVANVGSTAEFRKELINTFNLKTA